MRPCGEHDVDVLHKMWIHPNVREFLWDDVIITREQAAETVQNSIKSFQEKGAGLLCVSRKDRNAVIGFCGLDHYGHQPEVEMLYGLDPNHWGKGYATEMAAAMLRYGFEDIQYDFILVGADPPNEASFRVIEKLGMKPERRIFVEGLHGDEIEVVYYGIKREEFRLGNAEYRVVKN